MAVIDHLVYAVPVLREAIENFETATGIRPAIGGAHVGLGTHNALVSLGDSYLELIAPDPEQPDPEMPRPFGVDDIDAPTLVTFAIRPSPDDSIDELLGRATNAGFDPGAIIDMSRTQPDGVELKWKLSFPNEVLGGAVPFVIDWGTATNPSQSTPGGIELIEFEIRHPNPSAVISAHRALGLEFDVERASALALHASFGGPAGTLNV